MKQLFSFAIFVFALLFLLAFARLSHATPTCTSLGIPCVPGYSFAASQKVGSVGAPPALTLGSTPAEMEANFAPNMTQIATDNPYFAYQLSQLPDPWLARLSHALYVSSGGYGNVLPFLKAATYAQGAGTCENAIRLANAFGWADENAVVTAGYLPFRQVPCYWANYQSYGMIIRSEMHYASLGLNAATPNGLATYVPMPQMTMSLTDVFLEFYSAGEGTTVTEALVMMADWASGPIGKAAGWGTAFGTGAYYAGEWISPGIWEDMIENLVNYFGAPELDAIPPPTGTVTVGIPTDQDGQPILNFFQCGGSDGGTCTKD